MQRTPRLAPSIKDFGCTLDGNERQRRRADAERKRKTLTEELHFIWVNDVGWVRVHRYRRDRRAIPFVCLSPFLRM